MVAPREQISSILEGMKVVQELSERLSYGIIVQLTEIDSAVWELAESMRVDELETYKFHWSERVDEILEENPDETDLVQIVSLVIDASTTEDTETHEVDRWAGEIDMVLREKFSIPRGVLPISR